MTVCLYSTQGLPSRRALNVWSPCQKPLQCIMPNIVLQHQCCRMHVRAIAVPQQTKPADLAGMNDDKGMLMFATLAVAAPQQEGLENPSEEGGVDLSVIFCQASLCLFSVL